jgi:hypothetical protein
MFLTVLFVCFFVSLKQGLTMSHWLASNLQFSCLSLLSAKVIAVCHHAQPHFVVLTVIGMNALSQQSPLLLRGEWDWVVLGTWTRPDREGSITRDCFNLDFHIQDDMGKRAHMLLNNLLYVQNEQRSSNMRGYIIFTCRFWLLCSFKNF